MSPSRITGDPASRSVNPVLIVNPRSGGGKAVRNDLVAQCHARGIEPIVFEPGQDLSAVAEAAIRDGTGVIGMAGGDGSRLALRGVAAIVFGVATLVWPDVTLWALVVMFGAYALVDGTIALTSTIADRYLLHRGWVAVAGVSGIVAGVVTFVGRASPHSPCSS